ncbi:MAG: hypothetical protein JXA37_00585 [Chloroflexia bacterium]|nr:hypothetical protein [Chloroflexia bacterium]
MTEKRGWFASGKEPDVAGRRYRYALIALCGLLFAGFGAYFLVASKGEIWPSLLWSLLVSVGTGVLGIIIWLIYKAVALKGQK